MSVEEVIEQLQKFPAHYEVQAMLEPCKDADPLVAEFTHTYFRQTGKVVFFATRHAVNAGGLIP